MAAARDDDGHAMDATTGLYAQSILGLSEEVCIEAKKPERMASRTLVDCLSRVNDFGDDVAEKIVTGVMMIALGDGEIQPLEIRWASMLSSAAGLDGERFQHCCASARVIASMLRPSTEAAG